MFFQSLNRQQQGHYDTTHTAICVGQEKGHPLIAHISLQKDKKKQGYVLEKLGAERPFILFRHDNKAIANNIGYVAGNIEKNKENQCSVTRSSKNEPLLSQFPSRIR